MKKLGVLLVGLAWLGAGTAWAENAEDNRAISEFDENFFRLYGKNKIWLGKYQVQKSQACTDGAYVYAQVTDCVRPGRSNSLENEPSCEVGGYGVITVSAPIHYLRWTCVESESTWQGNEAGCRLFGNVPATLDVSGVAPCSHAPQEQQYQQQQRQKRGSRR